MKKVTITFDYEGTLGMPFAQNDNYDLDATTDHLLDTLKRHNAKAVFFVSAGLLQMAPKTVSKIAAQGHEIGFHGFDHEHMHELSEPETVALGQKLSAAADQLKLMTGTVPTGFRAPYLLGPLFYVPSVYKMLSAAGFKWVSNREIRWPEELFVPGRLPIGRAMLNSDWFRNLLLLALNFGLVRKDRLDGHLRPAAWLLHNRPPFQRPEGITEYPMYSPLDCDLIGFPKPSEHTSEKLREFAIQTLISRYKDSGEYFNLNFHDWIIGSDNRIEIFDGILTYLDLQPEVTYFLPGVSQ